MPGIELNAAKYPSADPCWVLEQCQRTWEWVIRPYHLSYEAISYVWARRDFSPYEKRKRTLRLFSFANCLYNEKTVLDLFHVYFYLLHLPIDMTLWRRCTCIQMRAGFFFVCSGMTFPGVWWVSPASLVPRAEKFFVTLVTEVSLSLEGSRTCCSSVASLLRLLY